MHKGEVNAEIDMARLQGMPARSDKGTASSLITWSRCSSRRYC